MNRRALMVLALALSLAVVSVILARSWLNDRAELAKSNRQVVASETTGVVVAATPLHFGNNIGREHLRVIQWPADATPPESFSSIDEILADGESRVALRLIEVNEPVLKSKVSGFGGRASLSALISEGMRATTIRVNDVNGVAGFVLPGDSVDVLLTREQTKGSKTQRMINDVLLQNVKVLGIDQDANESSELPAVAKAVTLEVTPRQAQKLALAQRLGSLSLTLRNTTNMAAATARTISVSDLTGTEVARKTSIKKRVVRRKTKSGLSNVRVVRGLDSSRYSVKRERSSQRTRSGGKPKVLPGVVPSAKSDNQVKARPVTQTGPDGILM